MFNMGTQELILIILIITLIAAPKTFSFIVGEKNTRTRVILLLLVISLIWQGIDTIGLNMFKYVGATQSTSQESSQQKISLEDQIKASEQIQSILKSLPYSEYDKIENTTYYAGTDEEFPSGNGIDWDALVEDNELYQGVYVAEVMSGIDNVYFDEIVFYSTAGK